MAVFLNKVQYLSKRVKVNKMYSWMLQSFHTDYALFEKSTFSEKPPNIKKLKLKQAAMQKDDGRPIYLKTGLPDKILYNISLGLVLFGVIGIFYQEFHNAYK